MSLIFIALDNPDNNVLLDEELFYQKYLRDSNEEVLFEDKFIDNENIFNFLNFIFQTKNHIVESVKLERRTLIDLSSFQGNHIHPDKFNNNKYFQWLEISKRENTMAEFGSTICVLGYLEANKEKERLYAIIENN